MIVTFPATARSSAARRSPRSISRGVAGPPPSRACLRAYAGRPTADGAVLAPSLSVPSLPACCQQCANSALAAFIHAQPARAASGLLTCTAAQRRARPWPAVGHASRSKYVMPGCSTDAQPPAALRACPESRADARPHAAHGPANRIAPSPGPPDPPAAKRNVDIELAVARASRRTGQTLTSFSAPSALPVAFGQPPVRCGNSRGGTRR